MADEVDETAAAIEANILRGIASVTAGDRSATAADPLKQVQALKQVRTMSAVANAGGAWGLVGGTRYVPPGAVGPSERE